MHMYVKIGTYTLAVLRYSYPHEPDGVYVKTMYSDWSRMPLKVDYTAADEIRAAAMVMETLPAEVRTHVATEGDL